MCAVLAMETCTLVVSSWGLCHSLALKFQQNYSDRLEPEVDNAILEKASL